MPHVACESKLRSVVRSFIHPWSRNWVTIGRVLCSGCQRIKCRNQMSSLYSRVMVDYVVNTGGQPGGVEMTIDIMGII